MGSLVSRTDSLSKNKEYVVMSVEIHNSDSYVTIHEEDNILFRIINDEDQLLLYPSKLFEISSNRISKLWVVEKNKDESISFLPDIWKGSFLEEFYNDEPKAIFRYHKTIALLFEEEN